MKHSKKSFLRQRIGTTTFILFFCFSTTLFASEKPDTISFIQITDLHFCNLDGYQPLIAEKRQHYGKAVKPLTDFFSTIPKKLNSDFVVITGDMIDFFEAESTDGLMLSSQIEQFDRILNVCDVPLYMTLGNHDIASYRVNNESNYISNQDNSGMARATWIRNVNCFKNGNYYSRTVKVDSIIFRLIFLDNAYYTKERSEHGPHFIIDSYQLDWLDRELKKSETDIELIFMHMPLFNPDFEDIKLTRNRYFLNLNDTTAIKYELKNKNNNFYNILEQNSSVRLIFSGHLHSSVIHDVQFSDNFSLMHIMTGSFGRDSRNWRMIQLTSKNINIFFPGETKLQYSIPVN